MFKTIQAEGGGGGPEWLSSHPDPGNRYNAIVQEASIAAGAGQRATPGSSRRSSRGWPGCRRRYTAEQIAQGAGRRPAASGRHQRPRVVRVEPPSAQYRTYQPADFLRVSVPANWEQVGERRRRHLRARWRVLRGRQRAPRSRTACRSASPRAAAAICSGTRSSCFRLRADQSRSASRGQQPPRDHRRPPGTDDPAQQRIGSDGRTGVRRALDDAAA